MPTFGREIGRDHAHLVAARKGMANVCPCLLRVALPTKVVGQCWESWVEFPKRRPVGTTFGSECCGRMPPSDDPRPPGNVDRDHDKRSCWGSRNRDEAWLTYDSEWRSFPQTLRTEA